MNPGSHMPTIIINGLKVALETWLNEYVEINLKLKKIQEIIYKCTFFCDKSISRG
jgi:hypothetical protein